MTTSDFPAWTEWLFFLPGDALIARLDGTPLAQWLAPLATHGSAAAVTFSAALWLLAIGAVLYLPRFLIDVWDPTYLQQKRERRQAQARAQRLRSEHARLLRRKSSRRAPNLPSARAEPKLNQE